MLQNNKPLPELAIQLEARLFSLDDKIAYWSVSSNHTLREVYDACVEADYNVEKIPGGIYIQNGEVELSIHWVYNPNQVIRAAVLTELISSGSLPVPFGLELDSPLTSQHLLEFGLPNTPLELSSFIDIACVLLRDRLSSADVLPEFVLSHGLLSEPKIIPMAELLSRE
jgi:hypothetical protein